MKQAFLKNSLDTKLTNMNLLCYFTYAPALQEAKYYILLLLKRNPLPNWSPHGEKRSGSWGWEETLTTTYKHSQQTKIL
jgi:hypothetical protein